MGEVLGKRPGPPCPVHGNLKKPCPACIGYAESYLRRSGVPEAVIEAMARRWVERDERRLAQGRQA